MYFMASLSVYGLMFADLNAWLLKTKMFMIINEWLLIKMLFIIDFGKLGHGTLSYIQLLCFS